MKHKEAERQPLMAHLHELRRRLWLVAVAFLLLNRGHYVKSTDWLVPQRRPRQIRHHLLPLARGRLWLWEIVEQRIGFSLSIPVPFTA